MRRKDNRGASFVLVVIAMAIVAILAVTVLWISLVNMQMKVTNKKNTDNFYSAEGVLDQICTGLQGDVSKAYKAGYSDVMQNYTGCSELDRQQRFQSSFVTSLKTDLMGSKELTYSLTKLSNYVDSSLRDSTKKPYAEITVAQPVSGKADDGQLLLNANSVVIKGVHVKYIDEQGYESIIETDISLAAPTMRFSASGAVPELFAYSIIGNAGVAIADDHDTKTTLDGSVYAGNPYLVSGTGSDSTSVTIPNGKELEVNKSSYFIAKGDLNVGDAKANTNSGSKFNVSSQCQVWSDNIYVKGAKVSLKGNTYVQDDLTLKCLGSDVTLGDETANGKFVGFGNGNSEASNSSAIIINGKNSSLDMSNLDTLMVSGYAYVNTAVYDGSWAKDAKNYKPNTDINTGESISVKGNQIAYLIPAECIGTDGNNADSKSLYNKNPVSYAEYNKINAEAEGQNAKVYTEININVPSSKLGGNSLSKYISESSIESSIRRVFVPSGTGNNQDGLVYYYVNLPADKASEYYTDYFNADKNGENKLLKYTNFYTKKIQVNEDAASIYTSGNYSIYDGSELKLAKGNTAGIDTDAASLSEIYETLNKKLVTDKDSVKSVSSVSPGGNTLFNNLISETEMSKFRNGHETVEVTAKVKDVEYRALVTNADTYHYDAADKTKNVSLIIASGNVEISDDFTGTIIAKGKVTIKKGSNNIGNNTQEVFRALLMEKNGTDENAMHLYDIFVDGKAYLGDDAKDIDDLNYTDLITYKNWNKQ